MPLLKPTIIDPTVGIELEFDMSYINSKRSNAKEFAPILKYIIDLPGFKEWYAAFDYTRMGYSAGQIKKLPTEGTVKELEVELAKIINANSMFTHRFCQDFFYYFLTSTRYNGGTGDHSPILALKCKDNKEIPFLKKTRYCQDGGGIEFSFPPEKLDFYQNNKFIFDTVESVMKPITDCINTASAGMHVHLGLDTFKQFGLLNFILFFYNNPKFLQKFAGRSDRHSYVQAGQITCDAYVTSSDYTLNSILSNVKNLKIIAPTQLKTLLSHTFDYRGSRILKNYVNPTANAPFKEMKDRNSNNIYETTISNDNRALFAICRKNYPTIECRMFQASSSVETIYSRIEFLTALKNYCHTLYNYGQEAAVEKDITKLDFDYINDHLVDDLDINKFYQYLLTNPAKYSHIINDLNTNYKEFFEAPLIVTSIDVVDVKKATTRRTKNSQIVSQEETV